MAMNDATKRKEPEPETEAKAEEAKSPEKKAESAEAPKIAVAVKSADASTEPEAKRLKPTPPDAGTIRKQVEYYLSDGNLRHDKFFHEKISGNSEGWLELALILSCNKMKAMRATKEDVLAALKGSKIEVKEDNLSIRRPGNLALPTLEARPQHQKKSVAHAHDGGVIAVIKSIPAEQSWMQIKDGLRAKLPDKVQLWFVSEVTDKAECIVAAAPFEEDMKFFDELVLEVGGAKLKSEVAHGDALQAALKIMPKHIRDKREKEVRKRQKERNRPIVVGAHRFVNVPALRGRVKEILNSRSDGEQLKADGSDYKLIKALLSFHPKGETKSKGLVGIKVAKSSQGDSRCFWMIKEDGAEEDFSAQKCLSAVEANPPYVEVETKEVKKKDGEAAASPAKPAEGEAKPAEGEAKPAEEKKEAPAEEKKAEEKKEEEKPAA